MGLFSRKQDRASVPESEARRPRARRSRATSEDPSDPLLLQRKRARRRLLGALTLAIAAVVFLPMVFDSEPQPTSDDLTVELPEKNSPFEPRLSGGAPGSPANAVAPAVPAAPPPAAIAPVAPNSGAAPATVTPAPAPAPAGTPPDAAPTRSDGSSRASPAKPEDRAAAKPAPAKAAPAPIAKAPAPSAEQQRALALLEGRTPPAAPAARKANGAFAVQIAALASNDKVQELVDRLSSASIRTYTEKVDTPQGTRTRVRIGPFPTRDEAQKALERVKGMGLDGSLVTP